MRIRKRAFSKTLKFQTDFLGVKREKEREKRKKEKEISARNETVDHALH